MVGWVITYQPVKSFWPETSQSLWIPPFLILPNQCSPILYRSVHAISEISSPILVSLLSTPLFLLFKIYLNCCKCYRCPSPCSHWTPPPSTCTPSVPLFLAQVLINFLSDHWISLLPFLTKFFPILIPKKSIFLIATEKNHPKIQVWQCWTSA